MTGDTPVPPLKTEFNTVGQASRLSFLKDEESQVPTYITPSQTSWLPNWEKSAQLVGYLRDPKKFRINDYVAFRPAMSNIGVYYKFDPRQGRRFESMDDYLWPEGSARPDGSADQMRFQMVAYRTERRNIPCHIGQRTVDNAAWDMILNTAQWQMQRQMTALTAQVINFMESTAVWGNNYNTFAYMATKGVTASGLFIPGATTTNNYIKTALDYALIQIQLATGLGVEPGDLNVVLSPNAAQAISITNEVIDFVKQSRFSGPFIEGKDLGGGGPRYNFSLPSTFHGYNIVVENASQVTANQLDDTTAPTFIKPDNTALILLKEPVRPGDSVGAENQVTMNMSTFQVFYYNPPEGSPEERERGPGGFAVLEAFTDVYNRRLSSHVVWDIATVMPAYETGYYITNLFS